MRTDTHIYISLGIQITKWLDPGLAQGRDVHPG